MTSSSKNNTAQDCNIQRDLLAHYADIQLLGKYIFPIAILINAGTIMLWESWQDVGIWVTFVLIFWTLSLYMCHKFGDGSQITTKKDLIPWYIYIAAPRLAYNLLWFTLPFWAWSPNHPETYYMIVAILISTIAMNASQSAAVFPFYILEMVPKLLGILITAAMSGDTLQYAIAFLSLTGALTFTKIARGMNKSVRLILSQKYALLQAKEEVERASLAKSAFLATMSHEVRTPLNGILGVINLMKYTDLDQHQEEYIETMRYSGETLLTMLNDVLDFSKMEAGKFDLEEVPFETVRLVSSVTDLMDSRAREKGLIIRSEVFDNVPPFLKADPTRLRQILLNLMSNAIKFTESGTVTLRVKALPRENLTPESHVILRFDVTDTGIGIPVAARENMFRDFTQVDSSISRKFGGSGLGLSICRRIVEMMKGTISFESTEGKGSTFWFTIPVRLSTAQEVVSFDDKAEDFPTLKPLKILLAEDNVVNQKVAAGLLGKFHHNIDIVNNGKEALEAIQSQKYDLVLMDMQMPVMDGLQATREIRALGKEYSALPIVGLSANSLIEIGENETFEGITEYATKPIRLGQLFKTFARILPEKVLKDGA